MKKCWVLVILITFILSLTAEAQSFYAMKRERKLIVSAGLNTATYYGDLKDNKDVLDARPSVSLGAMYFFTNRIGARAEFSWLSLSGSDADSDDDGKINRNLSFTSSSYEVAVTGIVNLLPQGTRFYQRPPVNAYGFVGVGFLYFNPKAELDGKKYALQPLRTEGVAYSRTTLVIPYGIGGRFQVNPFFNVCVEFGWRKTFTDYIDDVSTVYLDNESFTDPIAKKLADRRKELDPNLELMGAGKKRGDPTNDDAYMLLSVKVEYYLPYEIFNFSQNKLYKSKRKGYYKRRR